MNYLYSSLQIASGVILLLIPIIIFYWILVTMNMRELDVITNLIGFFFQPILDIIKKTFGTKTITFKQFSTDLSPLYLSFIIVIISILLSSLQKLIQQFMNFVMFHKEKTKIKDKQKQEEFQKMKSEQKLLENSTGYVFVKTSTETTSSAYLVSSGYTKKDIKNMLEQKLNNYGFFKAQNYQLDDNEDNLSLIFDDSLQAVQYCLELQRSLQYLNEQLDKVGITLNVSCGIYSNTSTMQKQLAFDNAQKICNLASRGEVTCSKIVKDLYEHKKQNIKEKYNFVTRGVYYIGTELEIYIVSKN